MVGRFCAWKGTELLKSNSKHRARKSISLSTCMLDIRCHRRMWLAGHVLSCSQAGGPMAFESDQTAHIPCGTAQSQSRGSGSRSSWHRGTPGDGPRSESCHYGPRVGCGPVPAGSDRDAIWHSSRLTQPCDSESGRLQRALSGLIIRKASLSGTARAASRHGWQPEERCDRRQRPGLQKQRFE